MPLGTLYLGRSFRYGNTDERKSSLPRSHVIYLSMMSVARLLYFYMYFMLFVSLNDPIIATPTQFYVFSSTAWLVSCGEKSLLWVKGLTRKTRSLGLALNKILWRLPVAPSVFCRKCRLEDKKMNTKKLFMQVIVLSVCMCSQYTIKCSSN